MGRGGNMDGRKAKRWPYYKEKQETTPVCGESHWGGGESDRETA